MSEQMGKINLSLKDHFSDPLKGTVSSGNSNKWHYQKGYKMEKSKRKSQLRDFSAKFIE